MWGNAPTSQPELAELIKWPSLPHRCMFRQSLTNSGSSIKLIKSTTLTPHHQALVPRTRPQSALRVGHAPTYPLSRLIHTTKLTMAPKRVEIGVHSLENGTMKEVPFPSVDSGSKILLSKVKGTYYATSSKCTHYGAPLVKGVLTPEGRVVCPWHGACFNVTCGDIEDAPGLNHLASFKVDQVGDTLFVTAPDEDKAAEATREPGSNKTISIEDESSEKGIVIVGGGAGGAIAVEALRESGYEGPIRVISAETYLPVDRTKLSKALIADPAKVALRTEAFYKKLGVEFTLGKEVTKVDFEKDQVEIEGGEVVSYDKVILATGGSPVRLPLKGADLGNITTFRKVDDAATVAKGKLLRVSSCVLGEWRLTT